MLSFTLIYKTLFIAICTALFCLICYGKLFVFHKKEATFVSDYTSSIALFFIYDYKQESIYVYIY